MKRKIIIGYNLNKIGKQKNPPCTYDIYDLELIIKDGTKDHLTLYADVPIEGKTIDPRQDKETEEWFFCKRLFGKDGLIKKQQRNNNIYLGSLYINDKGEYRATRGYFIGDNYTAQYHFDIFLDEIEKDNDETQKISISKNQEALNYAISDIHGMYGSYQDALSLLKPEDNLYIIGDVIDRGNYGIKILQDIIKRTENPKENPKITFLIGNHEWMLFKTINILNKCKNEYEKKYNKQIDLKIVVKCLSEFYQLKDSINKMKKNNKKGRFEQQIVESNKRLDEIKRNLMSLNLEIDDQIFLRNWLFSNGGSTTMLQFLNLSKEEQISIFKFLANSPVVLPKKIAQRDYLFVHAAPSKENLLLNTDCTLKQIWNDDLLMDLLVQTRDEDHLYEDTLQQLGYVTICGHSPTPNSIKYKPKNGYIRIDTACGHRLKDSKLALYCIERNTVKFINERENPRIDYSDGSEGKQKNDKIK